MNQAAARKIAIFTGTRAEYGLLHPVMTQIAADPGLSLQTIVSGSHLAPEFGYTAREIEDDGFTIDEKVEMLVSADTPTGISKSMGLGLIGYAEALARQQPDLILILGDRYEAFAMAAAALVSRVPIAHLYGGEQTVGAMDDSLRHAITKLSHLHFTSTEKYRQRVIQLGESPERVFNVGALGVENIQSLELLDRQELEHSLGFLLGENLLLITFHPTTLETQTAEAQFGELLAAMAEFPQCTLIFTKANADTDGRIINRMIDDYVAANPDRAHAFTSMGQVRYLSAMKLARAVVGNSSSGIIEAPSLQVPTVNVGDRQKGREQAASILNCAPDRNAITTALRQVLSKELQQKAANIANPYEKPGTSQKIAETVKIFDLTGILKKEFYDLPIEFRNV
ncbi:UDP-N-acetylglucosamine 2-epimerase [Desulfurivibrio dismutans]|uniref:UDP-N-acetylglucosamine 2-epimerase n=1 Tax=Desulfurivibrio dismutans TaxID=1398908 RepID=UPI0023DC84D6|nr:UDP-N-acetylglucosamine 2-epimerase [Desulfurivibrio alkaliphilus]MDF1613503.1 UDP-N-acetylglucosamine 2-epimerase [Desulfurivibrio alkaliphilus]